MDTRFWGPPAWILLHSMTFFYKPQLKDEYKIFYENLRFILPCIYCRISFTEYIEELPINLKDRDSLFEWFYHIHNKVNNKLRGQGLLTWENPKLTDIRAKYVNICKGLDDCKTREQSIMGWNFLYCVAFVFPEDPDAVTTQLHHSYITFFTYLGKLLPKSGGYSTFYNQYLSKKPIRNAVSCRETLKSWVYGLDKYMNEQLHHKCSDFVYIEDLIESYRAGCGGPNADKKPTCRRIKK